MAPEGTGPETPREKRCRSQICSPVGLPSGRMNSTAVSLLSAVYAQQPDARMRASLPLWLETGRLARPPHG